MFGGASIFHHPILNPLDSDFKNFSIIDFRRYIVFFLRQIALIVMIEIGSFGCYAFFVIAR